MRAGRFRSVPPQIRFLAGHAAIGVCVGWLFVAAILALDIAGLRGLMLRGADGAVALALLTLGVSVTFGSAAMGAAVMGLGAAPSRPRRGRAQATQTPVLAAVVGPAAAARRRL